MYIYIYTYVHKHIYIYIYTHSISMDIDQLLTKLRCSMRPIQVLHPSARTPRNFPRRPGSGAKWLAPWPGLAIHALV